MSGSERLMWTPMARSATRASLLGWWRNDFCSSCKHQYMTRIHNLEMWLFLHLYFLLFFVEERCCASMLISTNEIKNVYALRPVLGFGTNRACSWYLVFCAL